MNNYYRLHINCKPDKSVYESISQILDVTPMSFEPSKMFPVDTYSDWTYEIIEREEDNYYDFINEFLNLIEPNLNELKKIGITVSDILIWKLYEYQGQCAMEFHPKEMKRLGELGIHLNIDCWESNNEKDKLNDD
jgi:hypothetical protein